MGRGGRILGHPIIQWLLTSIQSIGPWSTCVTREEDETERGISRKTQVSMIFIVIGERGFRGSNVGFGSLRGGGCGGAVPSVRHVSHLLENLSVMRLLLVLYNVCNPIIYDVICGQYEWILAAACAGLE